MNWHAKKLEVYNKLINDFSMYKNIDSKYIQGLLSKTHWQDHQYIDQLIVIKKFLDKAPVGWISNMYFAQLKSQYPKEFLELCREKSTARYEKELKEINNLKVLKASTDKATKEAEELLKTEWQKAGGII